MSRTRIKICGIKEVEHAKAAVDAGADAIGMVFVEASPRNLSMEQAEAVIAAVPAFVETVGLLKNPDDDENMLMQVVGGLGLASFQLHGRADGAVKKLEPLNVLMTASFEPDRIAKRIAWSDKQAKAMGHIGGLVVDTPDPTNIGGGTGETFNWQDLRTMLDDLQVEIPIILAGGLTPENVGEAINIVKPYAVDVSSGVEAERGVKDPVKIQAFCDAVRKADAS